MPVYPSNQRHSTAAPARGVMTVSLWNRCRQQQQQLQQQQQQQQQQAATQLSPRTARTPSVPSGTGGNSAGTAPTPLASSRSLASQQPHQQPHQQRQPTTTTARETNAPPLHQQGSRGVGPRALNARAGSTGVVRGSTTAATPAPSSARAESAPISVALPSVRPTAVDCMRAKIQRASRERRDPPVDGEGRGGVGLTPQRLWEWQRAQAERRPPATGNVPSAHRRAPSESGGTADTLPRGLDGSTVVLERLEPVGAAALTPRSHAQLQQQRAYERRLSGVPVTAGSSPHLGRRVAFTGERVEGEVPPPLPPPPRAGPPIGRAPAGEGSTTSRSPSVQRQDAHRPRPPPQEHSHGLGESTGRGRGHQGNTTVSPAPAPAARPPAPPAVGGHAALDHYRGMPVTAMPFAPRAQLHLRRYAQLRARTADPARVLGERQSQGGSPTAPRRVTAAPSPELQRQIPIQVQQQQQQQHPHYAHQAGVRSLIPDGSPYSARTMLNDTVDSNEPLLHSPPLAPRQLTYHPARDGYGGRRATPQQEQHQMQQHQPQQHQPQQQSAAAPPPPATRGQAQPQRVEQQPPHTRDPRGDERSTAPPVTHNAHPPKRKSFPQPYPQSPPPPQQKQQQQQQQQPGVLTPVHQADAPRSETTHDRLRRLRSPTRQLPWQRIAPHFPGLVVDGRSDEDILSELAHRLSVEEPSASVEEAGESADEQVVEAEHARYRTEQAALREQQAAQQAQVVHEQREREALRRAEEKRHTREVVAPQPPPHPHPPLSAQKIVAAPVEAAHATPVAETHEALRAAEHVEAVEQPQVDADGVEDADSSEISPVQRDETMLGAGGASSAASHPTAPGHEGEPAMTATTSNVEDVDEGEDVDDVAAVLEMEEDLEEMEEMEGELADAQLYDALSLAEMQAFMQYTALEDQYVRTNEATGEEIEDVLHVVEYTTPDDRLRGPRCYAPKGLGIDVLPMLRFPDAAAAAVRNDVQSGTAAAPVGELPPALTEFPMSRRGFMHLCAAAWLSRFDRAKMDALVVEAGWRVPHDADPPRPSGRPPLTAAGASSAPVRSTAASAQEGQDPHVLPNFDRPTPFLARLDDLFMWCVRNWVQFEASRCTDDGDDDEEEEEDSSVQRTMPPPSVDGSAPPAASVTVPRGVRRQAFARACAALTDRQNLLCWPDSFGRSSPPTGFAGHVTDLLLLCTAPSELAERHRLLADRRGDGQTSGGPSPVDDSQSSPTLQGRAHGGWALFMGAPQWATSDVYGGVNALAAAATTNTNTSTAAARPTTHMTPVTPSLSTSLSSVRPLAPVSAAPPAIAARPMPWPAARVAYSFLSRARAHNLSGGLGALFFSILTQQLPEAAFFDCMLMLSKLRLSLLYCEAAGPMKEEGEDGDAEGAGDAPGKGHPRRHRASRERIDESALQPRLAAVGTQLFAFFPHKSIRAMRALTTALVEDLVALGVLDLAAPSLLPAADTDEGGRPPYRTVEETLVMGGLVEDLMEHGRDEDLSRGTLRAGADITSDALALAAVEAAASVEVVQQRLAEEEAWQAALDSVSQLVPYDCYGRYLEELDDAAIDCFAALLDQLLATPVRVAELFQYSDALDEVGRDDDNDNDSGGALRFGRKSRLVEVVRLQYIEELLQSSMRLQAALLMAPELEPAVAAVDGDAPPPASIRAVLRAMCTADPAKPVSEVAEYLAHLLMLYAESHALEEVVEQMTGQSLPSAAASAGLAREARVSAAIQSILDSLPELNMDGSDEDERGAVAATATSPRLCDAVLVQVEELAAMCPRVLSRPVARFAPPATPSPASPVRREKREGAVPPPGASTAGTHVDADSEDEL